MIDRVSPPPIIPQFHIADTPTLSRRHNNDQRKAALRAYLEARGYGVFAALLRLPGQDRPSWIRLVLPLAAAAASAERRSA